MIKIKPFHSIFKPWSLLAGLLCLWLSGIHAEVPDLGDNPLAPDAFSASSQALPDQFADALPSREEAPSDVAPEYFGSTSGYLYYASQDQAGANYYAKLGLLYNSYTYRYYAWVYQDYTYTDLYYAYAYAPSGTLTETYAYYAYVYAYYAEYYAYYNYLGYAYESTVALYAYYSRYYAGLAQYYSAFNG